MPAPPLHQLGDEPIYCEAVHDSGVDAYSGSEDDYYEGPLHRRLHIEKKAIDFLAGHVPVLLSARLRGPFDSQHWNNPWRSRRASRQAVNPGTQTIRSNAPVEGGRGHDLDRVAEENFTNTQGTSLYPLPSPEITNPPSARKNPYMEEAEYNRVKTWREAVKGTSVSRDPFWLSIHDDSDDGSVTRKRSADKRWLHQRASKKRKSTDLKMSPPEESPSQAAAKTRKTHTRRPYQRVASSIQISSKHEDELATGVNSKDTTISTRIANNTGTPRSRRTEQRSPYRKLRRQEAETSEDELSMPSTTPTHKAAHPYADNPKTPIDNGSPKRSTTATHSASRSRSIREQAHRGRTQVEKIQASQMSARQRSNIETAKRLSKDAARIVVKVSRTKGEISGHRVLNSPKSVQAKEKMPDSAMAEPKTHAKILADVALSQQDRSFCFHTRSKSPLEDSAPPPGDPRDGIHPISSSKQLPVSSTTVGPTDGGPYAADEKNGETASADVMELDTDGKQRVPCEPIKESEDLGIAQLSKQIQPANEVLENDEAVRKEQNVKIDGLMTEDAIQNDDELEATSNVNVASEPESANGFEKNSDPIATEKIQVIVQTEYHEPSEPEWSTYLETQDLSIASAVTRAAVKEAHGTPLIEQGLDDPSDPKWTTYVDTQDTQDGLKTKDALEEDGDIIVINQGLKGTSDSDRDIQEESAAAELQIEDPQSHCEAAMDMTVTEPVDCKSEAEDDGGSDSQWPTHRGEIPRVDDDQASQPDHEPAQTAVPPVAHAEEAVQQLEVSDPAEDSDASKETTNDSIIPMPGSGAVADTRPGQDQPEMAMQTPCKTPLGIDNAQDVHMEGFPTGSGSVAETFSTIEHPQVTDAGILDERAPSIDPQQVQSQPSLDLQIPQPSENDVTTTPDSGFEQTTASLEQMHLQSPWTSNGNIEQQVRQATGKTDPEFDSGIVDPAEEVVPENATITDGSTSILEPLAGQVLPFPQLPQNPWLAHTPTHSNLPTPDFTMSIRAFSNFATPSPTKKRASFNGSILRDRFNTPVFQKPERRVHFAAFPGEDAENTECDNIIFVEDDVSYFDPSGHKTSTMRVPRPVARAASPPPLDVSCAEVGGLLDHDAKFAKHFEAMARRKKSPPRRTLKLLPSDSQQSTTASQGVGAMAEAFIQASQTRRGALEMAGADATEAEAAGDHNILPTEKAFSPIAIDRQEGQENIEPVDDVSAVLDNLGEFLDDTWGVGLAAGGEVAEETRIRAQPQTPQGKQTPRGMFDMVGDPMLALKFNVWAE
ncbi:hypothetical protein VPNG_01152 [Cytospora leucostoma]|uniref:Protamine P1 n=1 Tax=Cytospora leucostoma TaxID=1230097 RepID=A0A423XKI8_9PEZI|nr:hypothetical protein VPNG_01152 [Cytospora leucostoma]